jgi:hypothetical protein
MDKSKLETTHTRDTNPTRAANTTAGFWNTKIAGYE